VTEATDLYTVPKTNGEAPLPRRAGTRTMLPSSWISRAVKVEYVGAAGVPEPGRPQELGRAFAVTSPRGTPNPEAT
jgi:hypothetical protein